MADWQSISAKKKEERAAKIPESWRLPESTTKQISKDAHFNVLDIPRSCGILTEREVELTEKYDATELLDMLASGTVQSVNTASRCV